MIQINNNNNKNQNNYNEENVKLRKRKSYFMCDRMQQYRNKEEIQEKITYFRKFINSIDCDIDFLKLKRKKPNEEGKSHF